MYFLSEEEKRLISRRLLPQARERGVAEELRGWTWDRPPLSPIYSVRLGVSEIAAQYCSTGRDVFLRRVLKVRVPPSPRMAEGGALHSLLCMLIVRAKQIVYNLGPECLGEIRKMPAPGLSEIGWTTSSKEAEVEIERKAGIVWEFEHHRIVGRIQEVLAKQPRIGPDSLVALALPVTVEQRLDGAFLGLSSHLSSDAFNFAEPMVMDVKFGSPEKFHRLGTAGYALVMESLYEYPVNLGCIVYASFEGGTLGITRDFHVIDDELRQWFIEERDERMRMIEEEIDPGTAGAGCGETCPYFGRCSDERSLWKGQR